MANKEYTSMKWFGDLIDNSTLQTLKPFEYMRKGPIADENGVTISNEHLYKDDNYFVNREDVSYSKPITYYNITLRLDSGVKSVTLNGTEYYYDNAVITFSESSTIAWEVTMKSGYTLNKVSIGTNTVTNSTGNFTISEDVTFSVSTDVIPTTYYKVYRSLDSGTASIKINGTSYTTSDTTSGIQVESGKSVTWSVTCNSGKQIKSVKVGSTTYTTSSGSFTISANTTITVTTEDIPPTPVTYYILKWILPNNGVDAINITVGSGSAQRFTASSTTDTQLSIPEGTNVTYTLESATGYNSPTGSPTSPITMNEDKTITVTKGSLKTYTLTVKMGAHVTGYDWSDLGFNDLDDGNYTENKTFTITHGTKVYYSVTAESGYSGYGDLTNPFTMDGDKTLNLSATAGEQIISFTIDSGVDSYTVNGTKYTESKNLTFATDTNLTISYVLKTGYEVDKSNFVTSHTVSGNYSFSMTTKLKQYSFAWEFNEYISDVIINDVEETSSTGSKTFDYNTKVAWEITMPSYFKLSSTSDDATGEVYLTKDIKKVWKGQTFNITLSWDSLPEGIKSITLTSTRPGYDDEQTRTENRGQDTSWECLAGNITYSFKLEDGYQLTEGSLTGRYKPCITDKKIPVPTISKKQYTVTFTYNEGISKYSYTVNDENNVVKNSGTIPKPNDSTTKSISGLNHGWNLYWTAYAEDNYTFNEYSGAVLSDNTLTGNQTLKNDVTISPTATKKTSCKIIIKINENVKSVTLYQIQTLTENSNTYTTDIEITVDLGTNWKWFATPKDGYKWNHNDHQQILNIQSDTTISPIVTKEVVLPGNIYTYPSYDTNYPHATGLQILDSQFQNLNVSTLLSATELTNLKLSFEPQEYNLNNSLLKSFTAGVSFSDKTISIDSAGKINNFSLSSYTKLVPQYGTDGADEQLPWASGTNVIQGLFILSCTYKNNSHSLRCWIDTTMD